MTIGIAVSGPRAGAAAVAALRAVEQVSRGAIGGFVSFAAIGAGGELLRAETQRGGSRTLFTAGESTGGAPPPVIASAERAVLMSSGPDRPAPLAQFTPADPAAGLVSGHRLPNMPGVDGVPLNEAVLRRLAAGATPRDAVTAELERNPEADAGLIALGLDGTIQIANSVLVARRPDVGCALLEDPDLGVAVGVLHNAIHPHRALAELAAAAALDHIAPEDRRDFEVLLEAGLTLEAGDADRVHLGPENRVERVTVTADAWLGPHWEGAAVPLGASVLRGGELAGTTTSEPYCVARDGTLVSFSGQGRVLIGVRGAEA